MKKVFLLSAVLLAGCSGAESVNEPVKSEQEKQTSTIAFEPRNALESVKKIDISNDQAIIKSAGVAVKKEVDSVDTAGEPKKIYMFADSSFGTQIELSRSQIILAWIAVNEDESSRTKSLESIAIAQQLAHAMLGEEGGQLVDEITNKGKIEPQKVDGHQITMGACISGTCLLKIER